VRLAVQSGFSRKHVNVLVRGLREKGVLEVRVGRLGSSRKRVCNYVFLL
jgi:biotin operon repressor